MTGRTKHGMSRTPEYLAWSAMLQRCRNPEAQAYARYGGRGITVSDDWSDFENFLRDMGPRPSPEHSLDREDNDGPYSKGNCRWVTAEVQNQNRSFATLIAAFGKTQNLSVWARETGIGQTTLYARLFRHRWPAEKALTAPVGSITRSRNEKGQYA